MSKLFGEDGKKGAEVANTLNVFAFAGRDATKDLLFESRLLKCASRGSPSLVMYTWDRPVLVLGRLQGLDEIDERLCAERGVPIVRRQTGGTAVLQNADLNIGLALPVSHPWAATIHGFYDNFLGAVQDAMVRLGVPLSRPPDPLRGRYRRSPICFLDQAVESLLFEGKKTLGCAQARKRGAALVHGTLLRGFDPILHAAIFKVTPERVENAVTGIPHVASLPVLMAALASSFAGALSEEEVVTEPAPVRRPTSAAPCAASARR